MQMLITIETVVFFICCIVKQNMLDCQLIRVGLIEKDCYCCLKKLVMMATDRRRTVCERRTADAAAGPPAPAGTRPGASRRCWAGSVGRTSWSPRWWAG